MKFLQLVTVSNHLSTKDGHRKLFGYDKALRSVWALPNKMYIEVALQEYTTYCLVIKGYSKDTVRRYHTCVLMLCKIFTLNTFDQITPEIIREFFYQGRIAHNWKSSTFRTYHKTLLVFFRWCVQRNYFETNPVVDIEVPRLEKKLPPKLNKQTALTLLECVYNYPYENRFLRCRNHAMFATFLYAGLRKSELLHLRLTDIDLENLTIFVSQGKGAKDRIIPMSFTLAQSLRRYVDERKRLKKTCPEFFVSFNRNMGFTKNGLKHLTNDIRASSKISFTIHKLRHSFATLMLEGGCDIYSLSKMMGHSDIKTTTIYLAASAEHLRSQMIKHPLN